MSDPAYIRKRGDKRIFRVVDLDCIGRPCLAPGTYWHRGATMSGSRNTGGSTDCCLTNANHGCPHPYPESTRELTRERRAEGMRVQR